MDFETVMRTLEDTSLKQAPICYCFGYTAGCIEQDILRNSRSTILERILAEKKRGGCECAVRNPKGR